MQQSHNVEIVPLQRTETGLRLRAEIMNAEEYDVVLREGTKFVWRRPAASLVEASSHIADAVLEYGAVDFHGDLSAEILTEVVPQSGLAP
jgi:hypothetical protein